MATQTELDVLAANSTPGLRKHEMTRPEKREHLLGQGVARDQVELVLDQLYPPKEYGGPASTQQSHT